MGIVLGTIILMTTLGATALQAAELSPPFSLQWGASPSRLVDWAKRSELDLLVKTPGKDPELSILLISSEEGSLPQHDATTLEARFLRGKLFEVTVHYTYPGQTADFVQKRFNELRRVLGLKYGEFKLSAREKDVKDGIATTSDAYHLEPSPGYLLMMSKTEVTDSKRNDIARRFSVVYHSDHVSRERNETEVFLRENPNAIRLPERK